jgi:hypothetical protein
MKNLFLTLACALLACMAVPAAFAATTNTFASTDAYGATRVYSVDNVRMITASGGAFTLQYNDGNSSDPFADTSGAKLASLLLNAPALKSFKQVGTSGVWINTDQIRKLQCQFGQSTPGQAGASGDTIFGYWSPPGYLLLPDPGCATYNAIKANSN